MSVRQVMSATCIVAMLHFPYDWSKLSASMNRHFVSGRRIPMYTHKLRGSLAGMVSMKPCCNYQARLLTLYQQT